jgi:hypothetical protein
VDAGKFDGPLVQGESDQNARAQIIRNDESRLADQTLSRNRSGPQGIPLVCAQIARDLNADVSLGAKHPSIDEGPLRQRVPKTIVTSHARTRGGLLALIVRANTANCSER